MPPTLRRRDMKPLVPVVIACASLLAGCGSIDREAPPAAGKPTSQASTPDNAAVAPKDPFQARAAVVAKAWEDSGIIRAWTTGFVPLEELRSDPVVSGKGPQRGLRGLLLQRMHSHQVSPCRQGRPRRCPVRGRHVPARNQPSPT